MNLKPFHLRTLFSSSSSPPFYSVSIFISHFSTSQTQPLHSHSSSWRHEEASRQVKVSVWWDFENCSPPVGFNAFKISHMITSAVRANGIKGPVQITAFGDISQLSRTNQEALSATGINLSHVPNGGKNSADRSLLVDLLCWVSQNPPPAHLFLISGDRDFASVLHRLRMNNYNVLLATSESAPGVLRSAASVMWNWNALLNGENLTGKHYNKPPDGPYGSWYGHYKVPLEDPFLVEQPACTPTEESSESCSDPMPRPVPKAVIKQIRQILNSNPKGISITDLRAELKKSNVVLDKDLYGYKRFSRFLLSMPHILRLQSERDGIFIIHGTTPKVGEPSKTSPCLSARPVCRTGDPLIVSSRTNGDDRAVDGALNEKSRLHHSPEVNAGDTPRKILETPPENGSRVKVNAETPREEVQQPLPVDQKIAEASNEQVPESLQDRMLEQDSASDVSFMRKVWKKWFGGNDYNPAEKDHNLPEKYDDSEDSHEKQNKNTLKKCTGVSSEREGMKDECEEKLREGPYPGTISSSSNDSSVDTKATDEASEHHSGKRSGLFNWIASWCKFRSSSNDSKTSSDQSHEKLNQTNTSSLKHEVFTQGSFWEDMEILIDSPRGSLFVTQSRTREEMAENLHKEGPLVLRSLGKTDLLHLVDLLISDKKWIEECPSQASPFKITKAVGRSPSLGHSHAANGLRSIFLRTSSQANMQTKHEGEKKLQNIPHSGVSSTIPDKKSSDRSRCEILSDCQNLVKEILKEHPEGYHMGNFRRLFLERYGYPLDVQRLGYRRLVCLLEKIPGIKIESCYIIPASMVPDNFGPETAVPNIRENTSHALGELPNDATRKGYDFDTMWDELGPVSKTDTTSNELQSVSGSKKQDTETKYPDYPSLSDDEFSDSERDTSTAELSGLEQKPGMDEEDSSLLQILDSWYSSKEGKDKPDSSENSEALVGCSEYDVGKPSDAAGEGMKTENCLEDNGKKQRVQKKYTFVAEPMENDKDKLINGILGSLKKSIDPKFAWKSYTRDDSNIGQVRDCNHLDLHRVQGVGVEEDMCTDCKEFLGCMGAPLAGCIEPSSPDVSDWMATLVLTTLLRGDLKLKNEFVVFWTPFILWHLGSPHNITAYSLEDNGLWLRHFFGFVFQVGEAFYIYAKFRSTSNFELNAMAIPIFVAGVIKYGERIWALRCASDKQLVNSFFSTPVNKIKEKKVRTGLSKKTIDGIFKNKGVVPEVDFLRQAYASYNVFQPLFTDIPFRLSREFHDNMVFMKSKSAEDAFKFVDVELGFVYDLFFTKNPIQYRNLKVSAALRGFCFGSAICSLIAFTFTAVVGRHKHSGIDVGVTYLLLVGAISLDVYSFFMHAISTWAMILLPIPRKKVHKMYARVVASRLKSIKAKSGIKLMAQHNLVKYCVVAKTSSFPGAMRLLDTGNLLQKYGYTKWIPVDPDLKKFIYDHLKKKRERCQDFTMDELEKSLNEKEDRVFKQKYKEMLAMDAKLEMSDDEFQSIFPKMDRTYFVRSIFLWHIATDLMFYDDRDNHRIGATDSLCNISKSLSDYMMYLTLVRPTMLCKGFSDVINREIYEEAQMEIFSKNRKQFTRRLLNFVDFHQSDFLKVGTLLEGASIAVKLQKLARVMRWDVDEKWEMISEVWMEMMSHAASRCSWTEHAQQLRHGGELLTHVALIMAHLGLSTKIGIDEDEDSDAPPFDA
ncbi:hypothetical protein V6N13_145362 [Hibiscus sabdariffa]